MNAGEGAQMIADKGVIVTGAGQGIGRALALRLAQGGARVVVNDLNADNAAQVALEAGGFAVPGDAASEAGVAALVEQSRDLLGDIDMFVANAGIERGLGLQASEADWAASLDVNLMGHVRAAKLLVPGWVERGEGRFVVTASAAGLLTMLGAPAYAVSKHGAVAFAEWLRTTYAHQGLAVHAICPQGVRTRMYEEAGPLKEVLGMDDVLEPADVAQALIEAMAAERFLVLPHPRVAQYYAFRAAKTDQWLTSMNSLQQSLDAKADATA